MLETAENVARRYGISREAQDEYGARSQQRAAAAAAAHRFDAEIVPLTVTMGVADKESNRLYTREVTLASDEGIRADTTYDGVARIKPALPGGVIAPRTAARGPAPRPTPASSPTARPRASSSATSSPRSVASSRWGYSAASPSP